MKIEASVHRKNWRTYSDTALVNFAEYQALCESQFLIEPYRDLKKHRCGLKTLRNVHIPFPLFYWAMDVFYKRLDPPQQIGRVGQNFCNRLKHTRTFASGFLTFYARNKDNDIRCGGEFAVYREIMYIHTDYNL